jgi:peptidoglycan/xylan/chitin deacetylase (PgdA/CDA1 family)
LPILCLEEGRFQSVIGESVDMRRLLFMWADLLGINALFRIINARKVRILMYHGVSEQKVPGDPWTVLSCTDFERQIDYVAKKYNVLTPSSVMDYVDTGRFPAKHAAVVTFDDGLANTHSVAQPVLKRHGVPAICFVLPGLSEGGRQIWADDLFEFLVNQPGAVIERSAFGLEAITLDRDDDKRMAQVNDLIRSLKSLPNRSRTALVARLMQGGRGQTSSTTGAFALMSISEMKELVREGGFEIGIHSDTHPILATLPPDEQVAEIRSAMETLNRLGVPFLPIFAYPNGRPEDFNRESIAALKGLGFKAAVTTTDGLWSLPTDPYRLPRIASVSDTNEWEFKARMSGLFYFLKTLAAR